VKGRKDKRWEGKRKKLRRCEGKPSTSSDESKVGREKIEVGR